jgi:kynurenine formamidase
LGTITPPDYVNKYEEYTTHLAFFPNKIFVVEYLCNLHLITKKRVQFFALPIPIEGSEGAPVRAIAIED